MPVLKGIDGAMAVENMPDNMLIISNLETTVKPI